MSRSELFRPVPILGPGLENALTLPASDLSLDYAMVLPAFEEGNKKRRPEDLKNGDTFRWVLDTYLNGLDYHLGAETSWQLLVGDDGSSDNTPAIAEEFGVSVISQPDGLNHGRGRMLREAFAILSPHAKVLAYTDSDGSYTVEQAMQQYELAREGIDIVAARRPADQDKSLDCAKQHHSLIRKVGHFVIYEVCERIAETGVADPQAGLQTFSQAAVNHLWPLVKSEGWAANREIIYCARYLMKSEGTPYQIAELEAPAMARAASTVKIPSAAMRMIFDSLRMRNNARRVKVSQQI